MINNEKSTTEDNPRTDRRSFKGDLSLVSTVNLFQLIKLASLSGHLKVYCETNSTHFIFTDGKLNYAFSRQDRKKRIGQTLLESQLITNDQLTACLNEQKTSETWQKIGSIVVEKGHLKESQLTDIFQKQLRTALVETMTWTTGKFKFIETSPLVEGDIILQEDIESLILQSLIMFDEEKN